MGDSPKVKAIRIRGQLHKIRHNTMSGYRTLCGKTASFGHQVYQLGPDEITCRECTEQNSVPSQNDREEVRMKVLRLTHIENEAGTGASCIYDATNCQTLHEEINEMQYCEEGEQWKITVEEMPQDEFKKLPEFTGW